MVWVAEKIRQNPRKCAVFGEQLFHGKRKPCFKNVDARRKKALRQNVGGSRRAGCWNFGQMAMPPLYLATVSNLRIRSKSLFTASRSTE